MRNELLIGLPVFLCGFVGTRYEVHEKVPAFLRVVLSASLFLVYDNYFDYKRFNQNSRLYWSIKKARKIGVMSKNK